MGRGDTPHQLSHVFAAETFCTPGSGSFAGVSLGLAPRRHVCRVPCHKRVITGCNAWSCRAAHSTSVEDSRSLHAYPVRLKNDNRPSPLTSGTMPSSWVS